jgi:toxin CcdB
MSATMMQFDVYINPISAARRAYPFVVAMQSEIANNASDQIVAPIAPRDNLLRSAGRLMPVVALQGTDHVVLVPRLTVMRSRDLKQKVTSIASARAPLLAAIDYLFFGV